MTSVLASVPSENWDDDFEFQARTTATTTTKKNLHDPNDTHRMSIASSDWDHDDDNDHTINTILEDRKNTLHLSPEWIEPGPSTPRRSHPHAENWDDDFEDSPVRRAFPSPPGKEKTSPSRARRMIQNQQPRPESWDDEFDASPVKPAHRISPIRARRVQQHQRNDNSNGVASTTLPSRPSRSSGGSSSSEDEGPPPHDLDFGYVDRDQEDRTVTARSRRAALSRLSPDSTPPPPVPALPLPFLLPNSNTSPSPSPFPRSPTSSVFSVPMTHRPPSSSAFTVTSMTHLRPTVSRSSSGLGALPPSPPIHRERERRRLRKKSRPQGPGIELSTMRRERDSDSYDYRYDTGGEEGEVDGRPQTPPPPPVQPAQSVPVTPSGNGNAGGAGALLSRIGSVKKWGVRRKRGSTTPGEVVGSGKLDTLPHPRHLLDDNNLTPRPHSQASTSSVPSSSGSSNAHRPFPPPHGTTNKRMSSPHAPVTGTGTGGTWFFRAASSSYASRGSTSDISLPMQVHPHTPTKNKQRDEQQQTQTPSPAKLVKRKSLGFVQLRRGLGVGGHGDDAAEKERERERERYAGLGLGRAGGGEKEQDVFVADTGREPERDSSGGRRSEDKDKEKDGSRSFMGSVRRISLVGRHKRTKSGVSLSNVTARLDVVGLGVGLRDDTLTPTPKSVAAAHANANAAAAAQMETPRKPPPQAHTHALLPPIELQPPSPPRLRPTPQRPQSGAGGAKGIPPERMLSPTLSSSTVGSTASAPPVSPSASPNAARRTPLGSPQAASLGRSTIGPAHIVTVEGPGVVVGGATGAMRRSSLGDLKIPERISQAQVGLRRDMERVREFAAGVEQLKELQVTYDTLVAEVQAILDAHAHAHAQQHQQQQQQQTRATSPSFFANLPRPMSRNRSNTNPPPPSASTTSLAQTLVSHPLSSAPPHSTNVKTTNPQLAYKQLASAYYTIRSKYRISWECAELLIELGSGNSSGERGPPTSVSAPLMSTAVIPSLDTGTKRSLGRERAITLGGEDSRPPTPVPGQLPPSISTPVMNGKSGWRASTGKHDLSQRQLVLLKEILSGDAVNAVEEERSISIPEEAVSVNREWRWGKDAMSSTLTLPSEDSSAPGEGAGDGGERDAKLKKKRRASRLGMTGLRDMLRSLKRSQSNVLDNSSNSGTSSMATPAPMSSTSLSTTDNSSMDSHRYPHARVPPTQRRRAKTSSGPESVRLGRPTSPYSPSSLSSKPSPRRPSLASIFRLGQKAKPASPELPPELREYNHYHHNNHSRPHMLDGLPRSRSVSRQESSSTGEDEEDWDRMDDASDMDAAARVLGIGSPQDMSATVRGKGKKGRSPYLQDAYTPSLPTLPGQSLTPKRSASGSQSSIWGAGGGEGSRSGTPPHPPLPQHARTTRLSNVEEHAIGSNEYSRAPQPRASSRGSYYRTGGTSPRVPVQKSGSVRSMPPQFAASALPDPTLAMTPENIRPLLENAKEVQARLLECIEEIRLLLAAYMHP